jgi:hypothetical protein
MNAYQTNLLAVDATGAIRSQWSSGSDAHWNDPYLAWSSGTTSNWQTYAGAGTAASPLAIVPNWPAAGNLDLYYINPAGQIVYQHDNGFGWGAPTAVDMP